MPSGSLKVWTSIGAKVIPLRLTGAGVAMTLRLSGDGAARAASGSEKLSARSTLRGSASSAAVFHFRVVTIFGCARCMLKPGRMARRPCETGRPMHHGGVCVRDLCAAPASSVQTAVCLDVGSAVY